MFEVALVNILLIFVQPVPRFSEEEGIIFELLSTCGMEWPNPIKNDVKRIFASS